MKPGEPAPGGKGRLIGACLCLAMLSGCATARPQLDQALWASQVSRLRPREVTEPYRVGCPDVLTLTVAGASDFQQRALPIGVDGRIDLGKPGRLRVEGQTAAEVCIRVAELFDVPASQIHVDVADYRSQKVYIFGQVSGLERAVAFRGEETVLELLHRVGGITPAASPNDVYVIRARVAQGGRPEVYPVKLRDIIQNNDSQSNVTLEPFDQIYVGETRRSTFGRCIPPIIRPVYAGICGMCRAGHNAVWNRSRAGPRLPEAAIAASAPLALLPHPFAGGD